MKKTNAIRILESKKIAFEIFSYEVEENRLDALSVAKKINAPAEQVFKTLVAKGDRNGINVFIIPGDKELDFKKAASASGNKKIDMIKVSDIQTITGYLRGGCSPIGMKKNYPSFIDDSANNFDEIFVSAGVRGAQLKISPNLLIEQVQGLFTQLVKS